MEHEPRISASPAAESWAPPQAGPEAGPAISEKKEKKKKDRPAHVPLSLVVDAPASVEAPKPEAVEKHDAFDHVEDHLLARKPTEKDEENVLRPDFSSWTRREEETTNPTSDDVPAEELFDRKRDTVIADQSAEATIIPLGRREKADDSQGPETGRVKTAEDEHHDSKTEQKSVDGMVEPLATEESVPDVSDAEELVKQAALADVVAMDEFRRRREAAADELPAQPLTEEEPGKPAEESADDEHVAVIVPLPPAESEPHVSSAEAVEPPPVPPPLEEMLRREPLESPATPPETVDDQQLAETAADVPLEDRVEDETSDSTAVETPRMDAGDDESLSDNVVDLDAYRESRYGQSSADAEAPAHGGGGGGPGGPEGPDGPDGPDDPEDTPTMPMPASGRGTNSTANSLNPLYMAAGTAAGVAAGNMARTAAGMPAGMEKAPTKAAKVAMIAVASYMVGRLSGRRNRNKLKKQLANANRLLKKTKGATTPVPSRYNVAPNANVVPAAMAAGNVAPGVKPAAANLAPVAAAAAAGAALAAERQPRKPSQLERKAEGMPLAVPAPNKVEVAMAAKIPASAAREIVAAERVMPHAAIGATAERIEPSSSWLRTETPIVYGTGKTVEALSALPLVEVLALPAAALALKTAGEKNNEKAAAVTTVSGAVAERLSPANTSEMPQAAFGAHSEKSLGKAELMKLAKDIKVDGVPLREIYNAKQIDEAGLRAVIDTYMRGGDVDKQLTFEIIEQQKRFERDPLNRKRSRGTVRKALNQATTAASDFAKVAGGAAAGASQSIAKGAKVAQDKVASASDTQRWVGVGAVAVIWGTILLVLAFW